MFYRVVVVWREGYDYSRGVEDWIYELEKISGTEVENVDPDTPEGAQTCKAYGVTKYPTILVVGQDGSCPAMFDGEMLPTFTDVTRWLSK